MDFDASILDHTNTAFNQAVDFVKMTDQLVYLTGRGTGKTTFLKYIKSITDKNSIVVAPTGVAAINAGGVTIHSLFQIPFRPFDQETYFHQYLIQPGFEGEFLR